MSQTQRQRSESFFLCKINFCSHFTMKIVCVLDFFEILVTLNFLLIFPPPTFLIKLIETITNGLKTANNVSTDKCRGCCTTVCLSLCVHKCDYVSRVTSHVMICANDIHKYVGRPKFKNSKFSLYVSSSFECMCMCVRMSLLVWANSATNRPNQHRTVKQCHLSEKLLLCVACI